MIPYFLKANKHVILIHIRHVSSQVCKHINISIEKINKFILDILFPIHCIACKKEGAWICEICLAKIKVQDEHLCPICEKMITPDGRTCLACKKRTSLDGLLVSSSYLQFPIASAVHLFKYRFISDFHLPLGELLIRVMRQAEIPLPDIIMPVPLHKRRLRWRGFNQSALLANHLAKNLLPAVVLTIDENILIRNRYTTPQMQIKNYTNRLENINGAFSVSHHTDIKNKTILIVDDIATTGSTIFECAKILKDAGAKEVFAIVLARQETKTR